MVGQWKHQTFKLIRPFASRTVIKPIYICLAVCIIVTKFRYIAKCKKNKNLH